MMLPENVISALLIGDSLDYLIFKTIFTCAEEGMPIWVIAPENVDQLPKNIAIPEKEVLKLITFIYLKDYKDLITHLNSIHIWHKLPRIILVNNFDKYCDFTGENYNPLKAAFLTTSLLDGAAVCTKQGKKVLLLATLPELEQTAKNRLNRISDLYFSNIIQKENNEETVNKIVNLLST